jgi:F-type H+-transporting ATPase subunit delta
VRQSIRGYADAVIEEISGSDQLPETASQLGAVLQLLDNSSDLRRVMGDSGLAVATRRSVISDLLAGQIGAPTLRLVNFVLGADRAAEFRNDVAWLAVRFDASAHGLAPIGEPVLGRAAAMERVDGYASAVLENVPHSDLDGIEDELFRFERLVQGSDELRGTLTSRDLTPHVRRAIVDDLLGSRASSATTRLAGYATQVGRPRDYLDLLAHLVEHVASENNRRVAEVQSPVDLDDAQQQQLADALSRLTGRPVEVRVTIDPSVLAGFRATVGDTVVDGSARHRLALLKDRLVMHEAEIITGDSS